MKTLFKVKPRTKKQKPVAISNYKASYLDKRSKTYHRIVMTGFTGLFGLVGVGYVFSSSASSINGASGGDNFLSSSLFLVLALLGSLFLVTFAALLYIRNK